jgi:hypothetical protein
MIVALKLKKIGGQLICSYQHHLIIPLVIRENQGNNIIVLSKYGVFCSMEKTRIKTPFHT